MTQIIKFTGKIIKTGNSHVVTVPAQYISNGLLVKGKDYSFTAIDKKITDKEESDEVGSK